MFEIEEMSMNAWPSLKSALYKGCVLRSSHGYTSRANSANPLYIQNKDIRDVVNNGEIFFRREKLPAVFKILSLKEYTDLDQYLQERDYEKCYETSVMVANLTLFDKTPGAVTLESHFSSEWIKSFIRINKVSEKYIPTAKTLLGLITVPVIVASLVENGKIIACGYGAIERDHVGFFDIVVDPDYRGRGWGRALMKGILDEAGRRGVTTGYLQVVQTNGIAKKLYESLGFKDNYTYWYRRKENK